MTRRKKRGLQIVLKKGALMACQTKGPTDINKKKESGGKARTTSNMERSKNFQLKNWKNLRLVIGSA